jgi:hypothetical protein
MPCPNADRSLGQVARPGDRNTAIPQYRNTLRAAHVERHAPFFITRVAGFPDMPRSSIPGIRTGWAAWFSLFLIKPFAINGLRSHCRTFRAGTKPAI